MHGSDALAFADLDDDELIEAALKIVRLARQRR